MEDNSSAAPATPATPTITSRCQSQKPDFESRFLPDIPSKTSRWIIKLSIVLIALLLFQIPLFMIRDLSNERNVNARKAREGIVESWGKKQSIEFTSPLESLNISATISPEVRYRGIYNVTIYTATLNIDLVPKDPNEKLTLKISDTNALQNVSASVDGKELPVTPGMNGISVSPVGIADAKCNMVIKLRGSSGMEFIPNAAASTISVSGKWSSPGFSGSSLPVKRTISADSFSAQWDFAKPVPGRTQVANVELCFPAGPYQQLERLMEYANYFLIVFFFTLIVSEIITRTVIHPLQYVIAAGAPVLFYLMVLAFGEHIGFGAGYVISAAVVVIMVGAYVRMFLGKLLPALLAGSIFAVSYFINFIILNMEKFSLLTGTVILAVILGVLMAVTGKINQKIES